MKINRLKTGVELIDEMWRISNISKKLAVPCIILVKYVSVVRNLQRISGVPRNFIRGGGFNKFS
jgi:hypothetical protein